MFLGGHTVDITYRLMTVVFSVWEYHRSQIIESFSFRQNINQKHKLLDTHSITELRNMHPRGFPPLGEAHFGSNDVLKKRVLTGSFS